MPSILAKLLDDVKAERKASIAVADKALATSISKLLADFNVTAVSDSSTMEVFRSVREHLAELIPGLQPESIAKMALGLSHSMSRHKLKFSADKIDAMVIQAIKLLDDLDKELNVYAMRTKEWYGWHFPELAKILNDNLAYCRLVVAVGMRTSLADADLTEILPEELVDAVKSAAEISMGTEITEEDLENIQLLAGQVITYTEYRSQLSSYLESRMRAIAPNLTALLGYLVSARLVAHSGSLLSLAKAPASTIQILGAEKALFRALKTKHDTPKYGLIYHASLVGQATGKNKGKIARMLAAKTALGLRVDALTEDVEGEELTEEERAVMGMTYRIKLENTLRKMEGKPLLPKGVNVAPDGQLITPPAFALKEVRKYNLDADGVVDNGAKVQSSKSTKDKKGKKPLIEVVESRDEEMADASDEEDDDEMDVEENTTSAKKNGKAASPSLSSSDDRSARKSRKKEKAQREAKPSLTAPSSTSTKASKPAKLSEAEYERLADLSGISVSKFKRKFERGDVELNDDGTPRVFSKKEIKRLAKLKLEEPAKAPLIEEVASVKKEKKDKKDKKRKHEDEDVEEIKKEKKQKKKRVSIDG